MAPERATFKARIGDPTRGIGHLAAIIPPDPATLFARRAARLDALADGHPMAAWLRFIAGLARAQHEQARALLPAASLPTPTPGEPPLADLRRDAAWRAVLRGIVQSVRNAPADHIPAETRAVCADLLAADADAQEALADAYLQGAVPASQTGAALFAAVALQVWLARCAAALPVDALTLLAQRARCPSCGGPPVAGVITAGGDAPGTRFLHCGLCATAWNHMRTVCIGCGEAGGLALQQIEGGGELVKAETCNLCHGYTKLLYEENDMAVEPLADDLASLGLDMLVAEAGFARLAPSPLVIGA